jgi:hypothetical protein
MATFHTVVLQAAQLAKTLAKPLKLSEKLQPAIV